MEYTDQISSIAFHDEMFKLAASMDIIPHPDIINAEYTIPLREYLRQILARPAAKRGLAGALYGAAAGALHRPPPEGILERLSIIPQKTKLKRLQQALIGAAAGAPAGMGAGAGMELATKAILYPIYKKLHPVSEIPAVFKLLKKMVQIPLYGTGGGAALGALLGMAATPTPSWQEKLFMTHGKQLGRELTSAGAGARAGMKMPVKLLKVLLKLGLTRRI